MYRLLIVDDEHHVVNWLADLFEMDQVYEFDIYKAYSGKEALAFLQKTRMDLLLLDIQMPKLNGLSLAEQILAEWSSCHIIFLTGYNNFEYIYKASKMENISYLLKSESDNVIVDAVHQTITKIEFDKQATLFRMQMHDHALLHKHLFQKDILKDVIMGKNIPNLEYYVKKLHMTLTIDAKKPVFFSYMKINWQHMNDSYPDYSKVLIQILNLMDCQLHDKYNYAMIDMNRSILLWLFQSHESESTTLTSPFISLKNIMDDIVIQCHEQLHYSVISVLYSSEIALNELHNAYISMQEYDSANLPHMIYENFFSAVYRKSNSKDLHSYSTSQHENSLIIDTALSALHNQLYQGNDNDFMYNLKKISDFYAVEKSMHNLRALETYLNISALLLGYINQYHLQEKLAMKISLYNLYDLNEYTNWHNAYQYLLRLTQILFEESSLNEYNRKFELITYIKQYIQEHLSENLSLSMLSEKFNYNSSYISHIFKQTTGIGISEYITMTRIELANKLLLTTNDSISDIADATGFDTAQYFSYVYKKRTGISPTDYRISHKKTK